VFQGGSGTGNSVETNVPRGAVMQLIEGAVWSRSVPHHLHGPEIKVSRIGKYAGLLNAMQVSQMCHEKVIFSVQSFLIKV